MSAVRLAWRNLWRNRRRSAITLSMVAAATVILILIDSLMKGLVVRAVATATDLNVGEAQIHATEYLAERSFYDAIDDPARTLRTAEERGLPAAPRSYGFGLVAHGTRSAGALFQGVDPEREVRVFELGRHLEQGRFLRASPAKGLVLGKKLARTLGVDAGDEIVVIVQAADGSLGNDLFTVTGILAPVGDAIDRSAAILHGEDFEELFVSDGRVHEIAVHTKGEVELETLRDELEAIAPGSDVRTWRELVPILSDMVGMMDSSLWIYGSVFFLAAGLGVMNTMLMATHERTHELGVLKAIGTPPRQIVRDVAAEASLLAIAGTAAGSVAGIGLAFWLGRLGIDLGRLVGDTSFGGVAFDPVWRPVLGASSVVETVGVLFVVSVLASLYPAILAARLDPVEAMRQP